MQYKDGKIIIIIEEFSVSGNTYNLNGIDLNHAVFFVREDRKKFRALLPAEYKIITKGSNIDLVTETGVLDDCIAVQVGFDISKISDEYNPTGNPDIAILKDQYNQLVKDFNNLWQYIKKQGVTSDALNKDIVIPVLKEGETIVMLNGSLKATPLVTAETELQKLLDELISKSHNILDDYVKLLEDNTKDEINNLKEEVKTDILDFFDANKGEFLNRTEIRKEINYLGGTEYQAINIFGTDLKNIVAENMYYYGNKPYMAIKTASSTTGFLAPDSTNFVDITNKSFNNARNLNNQMVFGDYKILPLNGNSNKAYGIESGYYIESIDVTHVGTNATTILIITISANKRQYQINSNSGTVVAFSGMAILKKL